MRWSAPFLETTSGWKITQIPGSTFGQATCSFGGRAAMATISMQPQGRGTCQDIFLISATYSFAYAQRPTASFSAIHIDPSCTALRIGKPRSRNYIRTHHSLPLAGEV